MDKKWHLDSKFKVLKYQIILAYIIKADECLGKDLKVELIWLSSSVTAQHNFHLRLIKVASFY